MFQEKKTFYMEASAWFLSFFEVLHLEPYNQKQSDRGRVWRVIAENLNTNTQHDFKTTDRSCGDRFNKLMEEFEKKDQEEKKASEVDAESFENGA